MQAWAGEANASQPGPPLDRLISQMSRIRHRRRLTAAAAALVIGLAAATGLAVLYARLAGMSAAAAPRWIDTDTGDSLATGRGRPSGTPPSSLRGFDITAGGQTLVAVPAR